MSTPILVQRRVPAGQYVETPSVVGQLSEIWRMTVPRGLCWQLDDLRPFLLTIATAETVATTQTTAVAMMYPIARVPNIVDSYADGNTQGAWLMSSGLARTISAVADDVDTVAAPTITCSDSTTADHRYAYVPYAAGQIVLRVEAPLGTGSLTYPLFVDDQKVVAKRNQFRHQRLSAPFDVPEDFDLVLYLKTADWIARFVSGTTAGSVNLDFSQIQIPAFERSIGEYAAKGEPTPGYNYKKGVMAYMATHSR